MSAHGLRSSVYSSNHKAKIVEENQSSAKDPLLDPTGGSVLKNRN